MPGLDGVKKWEFATGGNIQGAMAIGANGMVCSDPMTIRFMRCRDLPLLQIPHGPPTART